MGDGPNHGCKYTGQWRAARREGEGTFTWADGSKYVGTWSSNLKEGHGELTLTSGDTYVGQFKQDKKHGRGRFCWGEGPWKGHEYDGEWNMDRMEGKGQYTTAKNSGTFYISDGNSASPSKGPQSMTPAGSMLPAGA